MTNFSDLLAQAKEMQEKMKNAQESLKKIEVEGVSGGNSIKIIMNVKHQLGIVSEVCTQLYFTIIEFTYPYPLEEW